MADFKEHHALQGFRGDHVYLGTDTAGSPHLVVAVAFREVAVGERHTVLHQAGHLEVRRFHSGSCAKNQTGGQQKRHQSLHLPLSFGVEDTPGEGSRHSLSSGGYPRIPHVRPVSDGIRTRACG